MSRCKWSRMNANSRRSTCDIQGIVYIKEENSVLSRSPCRRWFHRSGALVPAEKCAQGQTEHVHHM